MTCSRCCLDTAENDNDDKSFYDDGRGDDGKDDAILSTNC